MKIFVRVEAKAKRDKLEKIGEGRYLALVREPAVRGRANRALLRMLAEHFQRKNIRIVSGHKAKNKIIELPDNV